MRIFIAICLLLNLTFAFDISRPYKSIKLENRVLKSFLINEKLYISTIGGDVKIYDTKRDEFVDTLVLKRIKNFFEENQPTNVLSVDELNGVVILLAEDDYGKKVLYIYKNKNLTQTPIKNESIKSALFLDSQNLVLSSISNDIYFYNIEKGEIYKSFKISIAMLSTLKMTGDRKEILFAPESGKIYFYDIRNDKFRQIVDIHTDNVYSISYKNGILITGGADGVLGIYANNNLTKKHPSPFVYIVNLNDSADIGAYVGEDLSEIFLFNPKNPDQITTIKTGTNSLNSINFLGDDTLISSSFDNEVLFWRVK